MRAGTEKLSELELGYQPSSETAAMIEDKSLIVCIGAFAVGKTRLMREIVNLDHRFSEVISFTNRPSRGEGDVYRFIDSEPETIRELTLKAQRRDLVNFAVHPTTGWIYGTEVSDYNTEVCILSATANSFQSSTGKLPFRTVDPVVVVVDPDMWMGRISERSMKLSEYQGRLSEARQSLEWSLDQEDVAFIDNTSTEIIKTASSFVKDWTAGELSHDSRPRELAEKMLSYIEAQSRT